MLHGLQDDDLFVIYVSLSENMRQQEQKKTSDLLNNVYIFSYDYAFFIYYLHNN